jgi:hypothetical protein
MHSIGWGFCYQNEKSGEPVLVAHMCGTFASAPVTKMPQEENAVAQSVNSQWR